MIAARREAVQTWQRLAAGACAGIIAATFTYPLDLARTRLSLASESQQSLGAIRTLINVVRHEGGLPALYRGLSPTLMVGDAGGDGDGDDEDEDDNDDDDDDAAAAATSLCTLNYFVGNRSPGSHQLCRL